MNLSQAEKEKAFHYLVMYIDWSAKKACDVLKPRPRQKTFQVFSNLHRSAWRRPQTQCSSGPFLPQQREPTGSHKHFGCVCRPPRLPSWASRPRLSPQTPSLRCWQSHYAATCGSQSCGSTLRAERRKGMDQMLLKGLESAIVSLFTVHLCYVQICCILCIIEKIVFIAAKQRIVL